MRRRDVLLTGAAALAARPALAAPEVLSAGVAEVQLAPEGYAPAELWCFGGTTPGPELRLRQGETLARRFQNDLPEASSVHWHGIRLPNRMDGVPGLTQSLVPPGASHDYAFAVPDAGTYWYHSHNRSWEQLARGLYGPLIVEEPEPLDLDQDATLVFDDWRLSETGALAGGFGNRHDHSHAGRFGNYITVNGKIEDRLQAKTGDRLRLRMVNAANARIFDLGWQGMDGWIVALDGMPLEVPQRADRVTLAPAQRADLVVDIAGDEAPVIFMIQDGQGYVLADIAVTPGTRSTRGAVPLLPPNPVPTLTTPPDGDAVTLVMEGGAMRGMPSATHQGEELAMRDLAQKGLFWALNGVAGLAEQPLFSAGQGAAQRIQFVNRTAFPHGMHLHGHHFREVLADGTLGPWHDTLLVGRDETREIALIADNPGKWLLHCHMLGHQAAGMKTWFEVTA